ncbi:MAG: 4a-hydroxytetrahydrobiopterin dehydratase [Opitutaceae bacterium]
MSGLYKETYMVCGPDGLKVADAEKKELMTNLFEWEIVKVDGMERLRKFYKFKDFADALVFTNAVGALGEEVDHHPSLLTEWGRVQVSWWTNEIRGLHRNDFIMAAKTDQVRPCSAPA